MKRFFCTICKKVKRVRSYPTIIENTDSINPVDRIGQCNIHSNLTLAEKFRRLNLNHPAKFPSYQKFIDTYTKVGK